MFVLPRKIRVGSRSRKGKKMEHKITELFLQVVAGDIEKLLLENQASIAFAYEKIQTGMKVSLAVTLDPTSGGISVSYDLSHDLEPKQEAPEKHKVKFRHIIDEGQTAMEFIGKELREGRMSVKFGDGVIGKMEAQ